jgi:hypothetical protein
MLRRIFKPKREKVRGAQRKIYNEEGALLFVLVTKYDKNDHV